MNLSQAEILAHTLMDHHGLASWTFQFDRAKKRFGLCNYSKKIISLSRVLTELNEEALVRDTILHEIAHALVGPGVGHGKVWKEKIVEIGGVPCRCFDGASVQLAPMKYIGECPNCAQQFPAARKRKSACALCCKTFNQGRFSKKFEIVFRETPVSKSEVDGGTEKNKVALAPFRSL